MATDALNLEGFTVTVDEDAFALGFDGDVHFDLTDPAQRELARRLLEAQDGDTFAVRVELPAVPSAVARDENNRVVRHGAISKISPVQFAPAPRPSDAARRPRQRERRPQSRRSARTVGSRGDPHPGDDDPEPLSKPWRGLVAASIRLHVHLQRRGAKAAA
jgi:hypothetical protein